MLPSSLTVINSVLTLYTLRKVDSLKLIDDRCDTHLSVITRLLPDRPLQLLKVKKGVHKTITTMCLAIQKSIE